MFSSDIDVFDGKESYALIQASALIKAKTHSGAATDLMFFYTIIENKRRNSVVGTHMEATI